MSLALDITIPQGQWWRIIYLNVGYQTSSAVGTRLLSLQIQPPSGKPTFNQGATVTQSASTACTYLWGIGVGSYASTAAPLLQVSVQSLPDLLWEQDSIITVLAGSSDINDAFADPQGIAVEIYTEDYAGTLVPAAPVATPLLT